jgi:hypothetical protein
VPATAPPTASTATTLAERGRPAAQ